MSSWKLSRTKQCAKCPWKVDVDPFDIPNGYCVEKHKNLSSTMASGSILEQLSSRTTNAMACHLSKEGEEQMCIGWLVHQLGPGNNIAMRLKMSSCENSGDIEVFGEQHENFEDTLLLTGCLPGCDCDVCWDS